ncbi:hypothetical protein PISL3812_07807 [Talaromyces islandicus]|uniref:Uncharacterized protein n=1 Tax=Talaromyces islandicus TaxID=28573 RepID=A0A0U1M5X8_TALIS|nr:hypothetical protein PISL3812_07807 [Talaromyces islandicus]
MSTITASPIRKTPRKTPEIQGLQSLCPYADFYPPNVSHAHPESSTRWHGPNGFGCRHVHDDMPFTLWDDSMPGFRTASKSEMLYIAEAFQAERVECRACHITIVTNKPPHPVPLTVAGMPAIFTTADTQQRDIYYGSAPYSNHRLDDPCPQLAWGKWKTPTKDQMVEVGSVLSRLINLQRVHFFPYSIAVEIVFGDDRTYPTASLPGAVAGLVTTYHHQPISLLESMKSRTRERLMDPSQYLPAPRIGSLPQDRTDYLREPGWGIISPGVRVSTGFAVNSGLSSDTVLSTTCGVLMRKGGTRRVSVANHGFVQTCEVYHPAYDGDKIGDIVNRSPELDIAMVQLTPANSNKFSNETYFQAEPPRRLLESGKIVRGTWFEVDGMSTGLLSFNYIGNVLQPPITPPGHPAMPFHQWRIDFTTRIFGATSPTVVGGICGAPMVQERTGGVAGFFHLAEGEYAVFAALDDLVAGGWELC